MSWFCTTTPMVPPVFPAGSMCAKSVSSEDGSKVQVVPESVPSTTFVTMRAELRWILQEAASATSRMNQRLFMSLLLLPLVPRGRRRGDDGLRTVDDARRDEHQQLGAVVGDCLLLEEPAEDRDLREYRHLVPCL